MKYLSKLEILLMISCIVPFPEIDKIDFPINLIHDIVLFQEIIILSFGTRLNLPEVLFNPVGVDMLSQRHHHLFNHNP